MIPDRTPKRPDGHECRGKCGGRLFGFCGEADPDFDRPIEHVCHDCLATKQSSKDVSGVSARRASARWQTRAPVARDHGRAPAMIPRRRMGLPPPPPFTLLRFCHTSISWRARRGRAAMAMPPSICRRPGCRSSKRMPLSQCDRQTSGSSVGRGVTQQSSAPVLAVRRYLAVLVSRCEESSQFGSREV